LKALLRRCIKLSNEYETELSNRRFGGKF